MLIILGKPLLLLNVENVYITKSHLMALRKPAPLYKKEEKKENNLFSSLKTITDMSEFCSVDQTVLVCLCVWTLEGTSRTKGEEDENGQRQCLWNPALVLQVLFSCVSLIHLFSLNPRSHLSHQGHFSVSLTGTMGCACQEL